MTQQDALNCVQWLVNVRGYDKGVPGDRNRPTKLDGVPVENDHRYDIVDPVKRAIFEWLSKEGLLNRMNEPEKDIFVMTVIQTLLVN